MTFSSSPNHSPPEPCSPTPHSAPPSMLSGTSSGPAGCPIPSTPSSSCPSCSSSSASTSASRTPSAPPSSAARSSRPSFPSPDLRWSHWTQLPADKALKHVKEEVFPFIKTLGGAGGSFARADGKRRVQDQQAQPAHRGLQGHRRHADLGAEPGRAGRSLRIPPRQAQHRRHRTASSARRATSSA